MDFRIAANTNAAERKWSMVMLRTCSRLALTELTQYTACTTKIMRDELNRYEYKDRVSSTTKWGIEPASGSSCCQLLPSRSCHRKLDPFKIENANVWMCLDSLDALMLLLFCFLRTSGRIRQRTSGPTPRNTTTRNTNKEEVRRKHNRKRKKPNK